MDVSSVKTAGSSNHQ